MLLLLLLLLNEPYCKMVKGERSKAKNGSQQIVCKKRKLRCKKAHESHETADVDSDESPDSHKNYELKLNEIDAFKA